MKKKEVVKKKVVAKKKILKVLKPMKKAKVLVKQKIKKPAFIKTSARRRKVIKTKLKNKIVVKSKRKIIVRKAVKKPILKKIKKVVSHKIKKHIVKKQKVTAGEFSAESLFKAKIKVIGVGGGGGSIVSEIGRSLEKATFVVADTDVRALKKKSGIKIFEFGEELTHGLGTGVNVDLAKRAAESAKDKISTFFKDQDIIIFVASLGGGLGSGATQVFAEAAKEFGGITFGIFTMPFKFEGKNKYRIAQNALKSLRKSLNVSLVIPNEKIFKVIDASTPITNAFSTVNKSLMESLESLIDLIYNPGVINIDFADVRTILKGRGNSAFLNTIEESGKDRVEKTCENIFKNPLLQNNNFKPEKILFNIAGSEGLSMFDVEKISSHISNLNPKSKIIFGISKEPKLNNRIKTTILMTAASGSQAEEEVPKVVVVKKPEVIKSAVKQEKTEKKDVVVKKVIKEVKKQEKVVKVKEKKPTVKLKAKKEVKIKKPVLPAPEIKVPISIPVLSFDPELDFAETALESSKKTIRRSGLEIKKAEEMEEKKKIDQEKEWEIPAFLRKVKFKN